MSLFNKPTLKVVVASGNPVKVSAALAGMQKMMPGASIETVSVSVPSGVADQPMTDEETLAGALNRVQNAKEANPLADAWVGIEGGVDYLQGELATFAWVVIQTEDLVGKARSGTFFLPKTVQELVEQGLELGKANDQIFSRINSKQKGGAIGILTDEVLDRKQLYEQAVVLALVPHKNRELYLPETANP
ncbi:non-canonical purine NTP phosphatase [Nibribacter ruber]|uniref:Probable inosine/xanthosine triphosphatase n=1 Tax=Nibribacter ruber TaxID=2698458 RepID=A0A6P1NYG4_9BACT|nr:inosine/xanthosine triphosphatase [Nibribacter ruber]QHL85923.1 non-canonical purine NTP phosphatase [Nibribacter ruber]